MPPTAPSRPPVLAEGCTEAPPPRCSPSAEWEAPQGRLLSRGSDSHFPGEQGADPRPPGAGSQGPVERRWPAHCRGCPSRSQRGRKVDQGLRPPCPPAQAGPRPGDSVGMGGGERPSQVAVPGHHKAALSGPRGLASGRGRPGRFPGLGKLRQPLAVLSCECTSPPAHSQGSPRAPGVGRWMTGLLEGSQKT